MLGDDSDSYVDLRRRAQEQKELLDDEELSEDEKDELKKQLASADHIRF